MLTLLSTQVVSNRHKSLTFAAISTKFDFMGNYRLKKTAITSVGLTECSLIFHDINFGL